MFWFIRPISCEILKLLKLIQNRPKPITTEQFANQNLQKSEFLRMSSVENNWHKIKARVSLLVPVLINLDSKLKRNQIWWSSAILAFSLNYGSFPNDLSLDKGLLSRATLISAKLRWWLKWPWWFTGVILSNVLKNIWYHLPAYFIKFSEFLGFQYSLYFKRLPQC